MDKHDVVEVLNSLIKLDVDAVSAYGHAIKEIDISTVREQLVVFRGDHERHIQELSGAVRELGGTPVEAKKDFKGYLIEGMTMLQSKMGSVAALKAMQTNERLTNRKYEEVRGKAITGQAKAIVDRNYEDERRHLEYIETAIREHT